MLRNISLFIVVIIATLAVSCRTSKQEVRTNTEYENGQKYIESVMQNCFGFDLLSYKMKLTASANTQSISANCNVKIKKDKFISISVVLPILGIEVARMEIDHNGLLLVDKWHKKYLTFSNEDIKNMCGIELNYYSIQALMTGNLFIPGEKHLNKGNIRHLLTSKDESGNVVIALSGKTYRLDFTTISASRQIAQTEVAAREGKKMKWHYNKYSKQENRQFPTNIKIEIESHPQKFYLNMDISRIANSTGEIEKIELSDRYEKASINDINKLIPSF